MIFAVSTAFAASFAAVTAASLIFAVSTELDASLAAEIRASASIAVEIFLSCIHAMDCRAVRNCKGSGVWLGVSPAALMSDTRIAAIKLNHAAPGNVARCPVTGSPSWAKPLDVSSV